MPLFYCTAYAGLPSIAVIKDCPKPAWGGKGLLHLTDESLSGKSGQELRQEPGSRYHKRPLLTGLLSMACSACSFNTTQDHHSGVGTN